MLLNKLNNNYIKVEEMLWMNEVQDLVHSTWEILIEHLINYEYLVCILENGYMVYLACTKPASIWFKRITGITRMKMRNHLNNIWKHSLFLIELYRFLLVASLGRLGGFFHTKRGQCKHRHTKSKDYSGIRTKLHISIRNYISC